MNFFYLDGGVSKVGDDTFLSAVFGKIAAVYVFCCLVLSGDVPGVSKGIDGFPKVVRKSI